MPKWAWELKLELSLVPHTQALQPISFRVRYRCPDEHIIRTGCISSLKVSRNSFLSSLLCFSGNSLPWQDSSNLLNTWVREWKGGENVGLILRHFHRKSTRRHSYRSYQTPLVGGDLTLTTVRKEEVCKNRNPSPSLCSLWTGLLKDPLQRNQQDDSLKRMYMSEPYSDQT